MESKYIVDRIEGDYAIVEKENGDMYKIFIENIKGNINEGDILIKKGEYFEIDKIFTLKILKELYKYASLNGSFNSWLQSYRKNYPITFYTKNDLKNFSKDIVTSLKNYIKS